MEKYIGVKLINAKEMDKVEFSYLQNLEYLGENEDGYLVKYEDGYTSWSPKDVFEEAYRPIRAMTFGLAIEAMKKGHRVARKGWNGKGMWVVVVVDTCDWSADTVSVFEDIAISDDKYADSPTGKYVPTNGYFVMKTADGKAQPGWLASQTDMLAEDWEIVG